MMRNKIHSFEFENDEARLPLQHVTKAGSFARRGMNKNDLNNKEGILSVK
jgi:hypothetical protein